MRWQPDPTADMHARTAALAQVALRSQSGEPALARWLGRALLSLGQEKDAESVLLGAVANAPADAELRILLARAKLALADLDEAKRQIDEGLRLAPQDRDGRIMRFAILVRTRQWDAAASLMDEVAALAPLNTHLCEARLRAQSPQACQAMLAACEAELARNPILTDANYFKALALARLGRAQEASEVIDLERFVEMSDLPAPDGFDDTDTFRAGLAREISRNPTLTPDHKATSGGLQTRQLEQPDAVHVDTLLGQIKKAVDAYESRLSGISNPFATGRPRAAFLKAWAVIYGAAGRQKPHRHPRGWLSGVYYVAAPPPEGDVYRGSLMLGAIDPRYGIASAPWGTKKIAPVPGRLVLFPSYVPHATEETGIEGARISVAFDVVPADPP
jgi:tetratricopeptide (TPR) repeat protein